MPNYVYKLPFDADVQDAFFKDHRPMGAPINLWKFFTDFFQNLAQGFIGIQEYVNDIVLKTKERSFDPWEPLKS